MTSLMILTKTRQNINSQITIKGTSRVIPMATIAYSWGSCLMQVTTKALMKQFLTQEKPMYSSIPHKAMWRLHRGESWWNKSVDTIKAQLITFTISQRKCRISLKYISIRSRCLRLKQCCLEGWMVRNRIKLWIFRTHPGQHIKLILRWSHLTRNKGIRMIIKVCLEGKICFSS